MGEGGGFDAEENPGDERDVPKLVFGLGKRWTAFASKRRLVVTGPAPSKTAEGSNEPSLLRGGNGEGWTKYISPNSKGEGAGATECQGHRGTDADVRASVQALTCHIVPHTRREYTF